MQYPAEPAYDSRYVRSKTQNHSNTERTIADHISDLRLIDFLAQRFAAARHEITMLEVADRFQRLLGRDMHSRDFRLLLRRIAHWREELRQRRCSLPTS